MYAAQAYNKRCMQVGNVPVPDYIPTNLSVFKMVDPDEWSQAGAIWIRTWYGDKVSVEECLDVKAVTAANANEAYDRLWKKALWPPDMHGFDDHMFGPYVFDDSHTDYGVPVRDADDEVELMDEIPSFVLRALVRCPDAMEGSGE